MVQEILASHRCPVPPSFHYNLGCLLHLGGHLALGFLGDLGFPETPANLEDHVFLSARALLGLRSLPWGQLALGAPHVLAFQEIPCCLADLETPSHPFHL